MAWEWLLDGGQSMLVFSCLVVTCLGAVSIGWRSLRQQKQRGPGSARRLQTGSSAAEDAEVIVVGAGVLGNAIATSLARDGRRVMVIERDWSEPDRIVGELLQPGGLKVLQRLGLEESLEGTDCHRTHGYVIHYRRTGLAVPIPYPKENGGDVPTEGRAFHHGRFISGLRRLSKAEKGVQAVEGTVVSLIQEDGCVRGVLCRHKDEAGLKEYRAPLTIVADGCFSNLRKSLVNSRVESKSHFVGLIMHDCPQTRPHHAEVVLAHPAPILVYQISSKATRILVDVPGKKLPGDLKQYLREKISPQLPALMQMPFLDALSSQGPRSMPNSFLPASPVLRAGVLVLGDAFNMRHPLTGAGMSVALHDVEYWKHALRSVPDLHDTEELLRIQQSFHWQRKLSHSFVTNTLAQALYALFAAGDDVDMKSLQRGCVEYLNLGGDCTAGPVSLLSILQPNPWTLVYHYFRVCLYSVYLDTLDLPWWQRCLAPWIAVRLIYASCRVIFPLASSELHLAKYGKPVEASRQ